MYPFLMHPLLSHPLFSSSVLVLTSPPSSPSIPSSSSALHRAPGGRKGRRILKFVDKIAKSKYFQKATENEFIKKKIEEMSNTPLLLTVEVQELSGTLVINIPPPPSDRIWYDPLLRKGRCPVAVFHVGCKSGFVISSHAWSHNIYIFMLYIWRVAVQFFFKSLICCFIFLSKGFER